MSRAARLGMRAVLVAVIVLCTASLLGGGRTSSSARFTSTATTPHNAVTAVCKGSAFASGVAALNPLVWLRLGEPGTLVDRAGGQWQQQGAILANRPGALFCEDDGAAGLGWATLTSPAELPESYVATVWIRGGSGRSGQVWSLGQPGAEISVWVDPAGYAAVTYPSAAGGVMLPAGRVGDGRWHNVSVTVTPTVTAVRLDTVDVVSQGAPVVLGDHPTWTLGAARGGYSGVTDEFIVTTSVLNQDILAAVESSV